MTAQIGPLEIQPKHICHIDTFVQRGGGANLVNHYSPQCSAVHLAPQPIASPSLYPLVHKGWTQTQAAIFNIHVVLHGFTLFTCSFLFNDYLLSLFLCCLCPDRVPPRFCRLHQSFCAFPRRSWLLPWKYFDSITVIAHPQLSTRARNVPATTLAGAEIVTSDV